MRLIYLIICLISTTVLYAQENKTITENLRKKYDTAFFYKADRIQNFSYYRIMNKNLIGACDSLGNEIVPPIYNGLTDAFGYFVAEKDGQDIIIAQNGNILIAETDNMIFAYYCKDVVICVSNGTYKYDNEGEIAKIKKNGKWGVYSLEKKIFIVPFEYEYISGYGEGLFTFCVGGRVSDFEHKPKGGKWGYINNSGEIIIDAVYDNASRFEEGYAQVTDGKSVTLIPNPLNSVIGNCTPVIKHREAPIANFTNNNLFVFIWGNNEYQSGLTSVSAINDSDLFYKYCTKSLACPEKNIQYIVNGTYANFRKILAHIKEVAEVFDGEAKIILYFSGLGATDENGYKYILPSDAEISNIGSTAIPINSLFELFNDINTEYSFAIIDAPFNGLDKNGISFTNNRGVIIKSSENNDLQKNSFIFLGSGQNGYAYNLRDENISLFTDVILQSMDNNMNRMSLISFIDKVSKLAKQQSIGLGPEIQTPQIYKSNWLNINENLIKF